MRSLSACAATVLCCAALLPVPATHAADSFEGVLTWRTVAVNRDTVRALAGSPDEQKIFALSAEKVGALSGAQRGVTTVSIKGPKVRADDAENATYVIMHTDTGVSWMILPDKKKYIEWTRQDAQALSQRVDHMQQMMRDKLATMSPEERKKLEAMMADMHTDTPGAAPQLQSKALGKTETINGMNAAAYEVHGSNEVAVAWVTREHQDLIRVFQALEESQRRTIPARLPEVSVRSALAPYGLPVRLQLLGPQRYRIEDLVDIQSKPVSDSVFSPPAGFEKTTAPEMWKRLHPSGAKSGKP